MANDDERLDELREMAEAIGKLADDIDDTRSRLRRVVQARPGVGESGADMEHRGRGTVSHSEIAICCASSDALEQNRDGADLICLCDLGDQSDLAGAGVREYVIDAVVDECADKALRSIHGIPLRVELFWWRPSG